MRIRPAGRSDWAGVARLVTGILAREFPKDEAAYPPEDLRRPEEVYGSPSGTFLVAEANRRVIGTLGVVSEDSRTAILRRLFVDPAFRGQGIGRALLEGALAFCRERGFEHVVIRTSAAMKQAIGLCRSLGFEPDGEWTLGDVTLVRFKLRIPSQS